jgi:hypothetical protein
LIVDPTKRKVDWLTLGHEGSGPSDGSVRIDLAAEDVARRLDWSSPPGR